MTERPSLDPWVRNHPKIVWDGLGLSQPHSGVGYHGQSLYKGFLALGVQPLVTRLAEEAMPFLDPHHEYVITNSDFAEKYLSRYLKLKLVFPNRSYDATETLKQPLIYHGLSNLNLPVSVRKRPGDRFVITVHDLIPLLVDTKSFLSIQMRLAMPRVLDRADAIIAISSWTRDTILEMFGSRLQAKITVINNGFDVQAPPTTGLGGHWILTVARGESYKRLEWIAALAKARPNLDFHVVTDAKGQKRLKSHQKNMMIHVGLSREELNHLYTGARVMIHPSLYEGWCLPAAEGLSRGLKLIYCPGSGIDEVAQYFRDQTTAVHRSEPLEAWITALDDAWSTDTMSRQKNSHLLPEWRHAALETLKIYENLL